jgi:hypothetical protein
MQLGRMTIYLSIDDLNKWARFHGVQLKHVNVALSNVRHAAKSGFIDDITFFSALGFDTVHSCDISECDNSTFNIDLNQPVPEELRNAYDVIIDCGTVEHVFNFPQVLKNIHNMLKPGGRVIFMATPTNNFVDHGYYMYSPIVLYDYYFANKYLIHSSYFIQHSSRFEVDPWEICYYTPGVLDPYCFGGCSSGNKMMATWLCAEKTGDSRCDVVPQQGCSKIRTPSGDISIPELKMYASQY